MQNVGNFGKAVFFPTITFLAFYIIALFFGGAILRYFVSVMSTRSENNSGHSRKSAGN